MYVKGVGPARAAMLETKGLLTVEDLLAYAPFRYEDRTNVKGIGELAPGEMATVIAEVRTTRLAGFRRRDLGLFEASFTDASRAILMAKWFHGAYLAGVIAPGQKIALYGKVEFDSYTGELSMLHPEFEVLSEDEEGEAGLHVGRIVPIYEAAGKVTTRIFRRLIWRVLELLAPLPDPLPGTIRAKLKLPELWDAVKAVHFPGPGEDLRLLNGFRSPAQFRLIFEEFFWLQCGLVLKHKQARIERGIAFALGDRVRERIKEMLPFKPTAAQKRVLGEIARDMESPAPMNRLLQGDVGSGKTLVAAEAAIIAVENGYQVAMLAPTEILASSALPLPEEPVRKARIYRGAAHRVGAQRREGAVQAGAHRWAYQDRRGHPRADRRGRRVPKLGLVIVDEQHRFGVMQRVEAAAAKGVHPDVLVMTATPIPRTLALTTVRRPRRLRDRRVAAGPQAGGHQTTLRTSKSSRSGVFCKKQVDEGRAGLRGLSGD